MAELSGLRVAILAMDGVEEVELTEPRQALLDAGAHVDVVAPAGDSIQAMRGADKSVRIDVDRTLDGVSAAEYDAVMLPGGALNADKLRMVPEAQEFVREIQHAGKPLAVICHGPWLLVSAGLTPGRTLTSYYTLQDDIRNAGGRWIDQEVVVDDNWVASRGPNDLPAFNREMITLFARVKQPAGARG